jgi:hypothetical protein
MCSDARRPRGGICLSQLRKNQEKYSIHDLELVAVLHALKIWRHDIIGKRCEVNSDHESLKYIFTQLDLNLRQ